MVLIETNSGPLPKNILFGSAALVFAFFPVLSWYLARLDDGGGEAYGLIPLALAIFLSSKEILRPHHKAAMISLLIYAFTFPFLPPLIRAVPALATIALFTGMHRCAGLLGLLLLSLPVQASLDFYFGYPFRIIAAEGSRFLLESFGYPVTRLGVQLTYQDTIVAVDPPCSGLKMLWMSGFLTAVLATLFSLSYRRTFLLGLVALLLCLIGNTLRATLLFFPESGLLTLPNFAHAGIGLLIFAGLAALLTAIARRLVKKTPASDSILKTHSSIFPLVALLSGIFVLTVPSLKLAALSPEITPLTHYQGQAVEIQKLSPFEQSFAETFPGQFNTYRVGHDTLIIRYVTQATRRLHPSSDCLLGEGFRLGPTSIHLDDSDAQWLEYRAYRNTEEFLVRERIHSLTQNQQWTEVSAWYWHAFLHPWDGPWQAETLIKPLF